MACAYRRDVPVLFTSVILLIDEIHAEIAIHTFQSFRNRRTHKSELAKEKSTTSGVGLCSNMNTSSLALVPHIMVVKCWSSA